MNKNTKWASLLLSAMLLPAFNGTAMAAYSADGDTGITALDHVENEHRLARENRLTDEQKQLLADAEAFSKSLRYPLDKTKAMPIAFEGDDLTYDERDGSFIAKGKVNILQVDAHRFQGEDVSGNTKTQDINVPDKAHMLQMTPGQARITLDGYKTHYNYGTQTGVMEDGKGKVDAHYITGKRFEFYPDKIVVYNGTDTKCGAKKPDYHYSAEKMVIYPHDKIVMENVKFYIKGTVLYKKKHYEKRLDKNTSEAMPRIGYSDADKLWIAYDQQYPVRKNVNVNANYKITGADGWRSNYDLTWSNRGMSTGVRYGYYEDSNDHWIKKQPSFFWNYGHRLGQSHFHYGLGVEAGQWYGNGIHSNHVVYSTSLSYDPIRFHRYTLYLKTGYSITRDMYNNITSQVNGFSGSALLVKDFDDKWAAYTGYYYDKTNSSNSVFNFDTDDFSRKVLAGLSYRIDDRNRVAVGTRYDLDHNQMADVDYYWYHDMHCTQFILRYKSKTNAWNIRWQFTPW